MQSMGWHLCFPCGYPIILVSFVEKNILPLLNCLCTFTESQLTCGTIFGPSSLFHWSIRLYFLQYTLIFFFFLAALCSMWILAPQHVPPALGVWSLFCFVLFSGCVGSSLLRGGFLQLLRAGATLCSGARASHCGGFSCWGAQAPGAPASVVVVQRLSCSAACGIFLDQRSNLCPLYCQADS